MNKMILALTLLTALLSTVGAQVAEVHLPADPNQPVLKVEDLYEAAGNNSPPMILIYADGRVVKPVSENKKDDFTITIEANRLEELLKEIIEDNKFLDMKAQDIKNEVVSKRKLERLRPGFEFRIEMNLADKTHVVSVGNTWVYQRLLRGRIRHKDAKVFQRFLNVEELCRRISNWALVGGEAEMQTILETADKMTQKAYPGAPEITESNILSLKSKDGKTAVMFLGVAKTLDTPPLNVIVTKVKGEGKKQGDGEGEEGVVKNGGDFDIEIKVNHPRPLNDVRKPPTA